jgi:2-polyprenyl-3-methyl-5-hydroxy-6-metoxy-1,4-benzoquinol methylase
MTQKPSPEKILQMATAHWQAAILSAAEAHGVFTVLEEGAATAEEVAEKARISRRGSRALLDGLVGLGLVELRDGRYANQVEASAYLVHGREPYLGDYVRVHTSAMDEWTNLAEIVHRGQSPHVVADRAESSFWEELAPAIAAKVRPAAEQAADLLEIAAMEAPRFLDVGGGSGVYATVWLHKNPGARVTQVDWANVNRLARKFLERQGVGERFETVDSDFHTADFGEEEYDVVVLSNIAHQESPESNVMLFERAGRALKPEGTLLLNDLVLQDDGEDSPFAYLFHVNMLLHTSAGAVYRRCEYESWLREAGFASIVFAPTATATTLILARRG